MCFETPSDWSMRSTIGSGVSQWAQHWRSDKRPPLPCFTWHRQRVSVPYRLKRNRSSDATHRLSSLSASGTHNRSHGPNALTPGKSRLHRASYPVSWQAPELDNISIFQSVHHAISSAISRWVCVFLHYGWLHSSEWLPVGWSYRWDPRGAERSSAFPSLMSIGGTLARTNTALVDTVRYTKTILSATPFCAEESFLWKAWLLRALTQAGTA